MHQDDPASDFRLAIEVKCSNNAIAGSINASGPISEVSDTATARLHCASDLVQASLAVRSFSAGLCQRLHEFEWRWGLSWKRRRGDDGGDDSC